MQNDNSKLFSIPPHFLTDWNEVSGLFSSDTGLHIYLKSGQEVTIPNLAQASLDEIFSTYSQFISKKEKLPIVEKTEQDKAFESVQKGLREVLSLTVKFGTSALGQMGNVLEHNPAHSELPPLPPEMVERIQVLANVIPQEDLKAMSPPVDGCFCLYCQIQRIIRNAPSQQVDLKDATIKDEEVNDEELQFTEWEVHPIADKLYKVSSKLDPKEEYQVFLGEPMGCTCGKPHCEHVVAVLRS